jgi:hypothetical protein
MLGLSNRMRFLDLLGDFASFMLPRVLVQHLHALAHTMCYLSGGENLAALPNI